MSPGSDLAQIPAEKLATSNLLPAHLRDNPVNTAVMVSTLQALELPVTFMNLGETYVVNGRPGLMAALQRTIAWRHGWAITPVEVGPERAVVRIYHRSGREAAQLVAFTMADAERARLPERNPTYKQYPDRMLFARACTKAIALFCPQILFGPMDGTANAWEWDAIEATSSEGETIPTEIYDDQPEAYADPTGEKFDPEDPTRPFE